MVVSASLKCMFNKPKICSFVFREISIDESIICFWMNSCIKAIYLMFWKNRRFFHHKVIDDFDMFHSVFVVLISENDIIWISIFFHLNANYFVTFFNFAHKFHFNLQNILTIWKTLRFIGFLLKMKNKMIEKMNWNVCNVPTKKSIWNKNSSHSDNHIFY